MENYEISTDKYNPLRHNNREGILTVKETENYLRIGHNSMYNLIASKKLSSFKINRRRLISKESIEKFIKNSEEEEKIYG